MKFQDFVSYKYHKVPMWPQYSKKNIVVFNVRMMEMDLPDIFSSNLQSSTIVSN
jgi:hypothetical protein